MIDVTLLWAEPDELACGLVLRGEGTVYPDGAVELADGAPLHVDGEELVLAGGDCEGGGVASCLTMSRPSMRLMSR